jgi:homocysteine S-methyltransferase
VPVALPHHHAPDAGPFVTDGGLETSLIFHDGIDLPEFAAFPLLEDERGRDALRAYFRAYLDLAVARGTGVVVDTVTWRANPDWGARLGYDAAALDRVNRDAVAFARTLAEPAADGGVPALVNGVVGPRGDGYDPEAFMTADAAEAYHGPQLASFAAAGADMTSAVTMTYPAEAIGIARAAGAHGLPVVVSFTVETDGRLPDGTPLGAAIEEVDASTGAAPIYYMINCAHPTHFEAVLDDAGAWRERIGGLRANASTASHAELDEAEELDDGDPDDLGRRYGALRDRLPNVMVIGGCCGTDIRHVSAACAAWSGAAAAR